MGTLANITIRQTLPAVVRYINNPDKNRPPDGLANAAAYISGDHAVEHLFSRGHNGCSGNPKLAVRQFRACEAMYRDRKGGAKEAGLCWYEMTPENYKKKFGHSPAELNENGKVWVEKKPVIAEHIIASLADGEKPSYEEQCAIDDELCASPLLRDFYCISNRHYNTDNRHTHILVSAFSKDGSRKLSFNNSARKELRKEYDRILVRHGLSIIDAPELRYGDPEHEKWIRRLVDEGKTTVYVPSDFVLKYDWWKAKNPGKTREYDEWMLGQIRQGSVKIAEEGSYNRVWDKATGKHHSTPQSGAYRRWVAKNGALYDKNKDAAEQEEFIRAKKTELEERQKRVYYYEEQWKKNGRYYAANRYRRDGSRKTTLELTLELCLVILDKEYLLFDPNSVEPLPAEAPNEEFFARTNREQQAIIDFYEGCRRLDVRTPEELECRKQAVGKSIAETKQAIAYCKKIAENNDDQRAGAKAADLEAQLKSLNKDYHDIMFIGSHLNEYRYQAQERMNVTPQDFDYLLQDALDRASKLKTQKEARDGRDCG